MSATEKVYDDSDADDIEKSFPEDAFHRNVDLSIVRADQEGKHHHHLFAPPFSLTASRRIYKVVHRPPEHNLGHREEHARRRGHLQPLLNANPHHHPGVPGQGPRRHGRQRPRAVAQRRDRRGYASLFHQSCYSRTSAVTDLYIILYDAITANPGKVGHGRDGYYFGIAGEHSWYDISKQIGKVFVELGISTEDEPTTFSRDELVKYFGSLVRHCLGIVLRWLNWGMIVVRTVSWDELTRGGDAFEVAWVEPEERHPGNAREYQA